MTWPLRRGSAARRIAADYAYALDWILDGGLRPAAAGAESEREDDPWTDLGGEG